jgi:putative transcriptional regulator
MNSLKGRLLVATPELVDPNFARTVLLMLEHTDDGAVGIILNRPTEASVSDISEQVLGEEFDWEKPIRLGGPVPGPLMVLHTWESLADREIFDGLFTTADAEKLETLLRQKREPSVIIANYAGWGPGQLEREMSEGSWFTIPATCDHIFVADSAELWDEATREAPTTNISELLKLRTIPPDPSLN